ncbi:MAG: DNA recombination protein RmuC [Lachnospiraceae bacterium]|nr:DNA recombination protein RmuC [Lachnospiraceae bacterium]
MKNIEVVDQHQKGIYERISSQQSDMRKELSAAQQQQRQELTGSVQNSLSAVSKILVDNQRSVAQTQAALLGNIEERIKTFSLENEQKLSGIRRSMQEQLDRIQNDNNKKLDEMRMIVTDKLNQTIDRRMTESFKLVNDRLEQVYKGLGEMQTLAVGVGDLKKVLSNVKARGILGEIQLGSILREILSPEQYSENIATKKNSRNVVEFAVKLPSEDGSIVYLPIDSKFPGDTYAALRSAYESCDQNAINEAAKALIRTIKLEAKDIHDKYIDPPNTTDFAIMFLPFEGLYSEVVNRGMIEVLQREYRVNIAGPSTMAALLNSLQMGFRTLAVKKHSSEVWKLLEEITTEFDTFSSVLMSTQQKLRQADNELDRLVGVRTRQMRKKLSQVSQFKEN